MTVADFLTWDDGTDTRYELIDGRPVAMAPVAASHSVIVANLGTALRGKPRRRYAGMMAGVIPPDRQLHATRTPHAHDPAADRRDRGAFAVDRRT
jgi:Putative restriction endonuclease